MATAPETLWRRFVDGRPVSAVTAPFVTWTCAHLAATGTTTLVVIWDNASWHIRRAVHDGLRTHNQRVHR